MRLPASASAWGTPEFAAVFKRELAEHADALPLQQALSGTSAVSDDPVTIVLLDACAEGARIQIKAGVFFAGILAGCSCADDPTPVEAQTEYCELFLEIDRLSAETVLRLDA